MMVRKPQIKDVVNFDGTEYVIRAIVAEDDTIVLGLLGDPSSRTFLMSGAELTWQEVLHAWRPVSVAGFSEAE